MSLQCNEAGLKDVANTDAYDDLGDDNDSKICACAPDAKQGRATKNLVSFLWKVTSFSQGSTCSVQQTNPNHITSP